MPASISISIFFVPNGIPVYHGWLPLRKKEKKNYYIIEQIPLVCLGANLSHCPYNVYILELVVHLELTLDICPTQP